MSMFIVFINRDVVKYILCLSL